MITHPPVIGSSNPAFPGVHVLGQTAWHMEDKLDSPPVTDTEKLGDPQPLELNFLYCKTTGLEAIVFLIFICSASR